MFPLAVVCAAVPAVPQGSPPAGFPERPPVIRLRSSIDLPGTAGRIDHLALDLARRRLFVAARGNGSVEVVDLAAGVREQSLPGFSEPQGVLFLDREDRILVTNGGTGTLDVLEGSKCEKVASVAVGPDADNLRYDPRTRLVYVGFGEGERGALAIVGTADWKLVGEIPLGGHPESFQFDEKGERAFVNVPSKHGIAVVDLERRKVVDTWTIEDGDNFPMAIQSGDRRLFIGCRTPAHLLVVDPADGRTIETIPLGPDVDDLFLDEVSGRVFAACGAAVIDIFEPRDGGRYSPFERYGTRPGSRTCLFSPTEATLYLAVPARGNRGAQIQLYEALR